MSTLRIHGIEAKSDPTSASVNEKIKITNSNGDLLFHLDGTQSGIGTVGITTTGTTFHVDRATGEITFVTDANFNGTVGIAGTLTYEDVTNIDSVGVITARDGLRVTGIALQLHFMVMDHNSLVYLLVLLVVHQLTKYFLRMTIQSM